MDKIRIFVYKTSRNIDFFKRILSEASFKNEKWGIYNEGGFRFGINSMGNCLKVTFNPSDIATRAVKHGWKENVSYDETLKVYKLLENMGLNLEDTSLSYLEIGLTLLMDKEPKEYFKCLAKLPYFTRRLIFEGNTLYYNTPKTMNKSIIFYDKRMEVERKREARYKDQEHEKKAHYLRYEIRLSKRSIRTNKKIKQISSLQDLTDFKNYSSCLELLKTNYSKIKKTKHNIRLERELKDKIEREIKKLTLPYADKYQ